MRKMLAGLLAGVLLLSGCTAQAAAKSDDTAAVTQQPAENAAVQGGFVENQTLDGADGIIHFSYYLPDSYDSAKTYPLIVTMPGYGEMWFGEDSAGSNLSWNGVQAWTKLSEPVILVSGQLTDWGTKSARQANELAEYMIDHFSVDTSRVYAAGYSAGGETMSQAVALRPDLYAAYIHGGSQWDGTYDPVADSTYSGEVLLWNADDPNDPITIGYGKITPGKRSFTFSNLSSAHRYRITCDGNEELILTITDGRNVSFFGSMKNVFNMISEMILF